MLTSKLTASLVGMTARQGAEGRGVDVTGRLVAKWAQLDRHPFDRAPVARKL
jgi:hypothetical protein